LCDVPCSGDGSYSCECFTSNINWFLQAHSVKTFSSGRSSIWKRVVHFIRMLVFVGSLLSF
jgi:hypothetical protein